MTTNTEHRRRETDKLGQFIQQAALDHANARIAELEGLLDLAVVELTLSNRFAVREDLRDLVEAIDAILPTPSEK